MTIKFGYKLKNYLQNIKLNIKRFHLFMIKKKK